MRSTGFFPRSRRHSRLLAPVNSILPKKAWRWGSGAYSSIGEEILKFERLHEIGVPNHTAIFDAHISKPFIDLGDFLDSLLQ